ncbi:hypothetical protein D3877_02020 [Azospirillum cavernae]|uniref:HNH endonuclease n=1 Tax=Azospirillum cavernae TaxID=2320860 RepID=A0A418W0C7_9PROT|nr:hypothetical protein [Azospirillum cavernae]RJF83470.1 hypothetical protein D3877_02020 [Azospirillum cavernae]
MGSKETRRFALAEAQNWRCAHCGGGMLMQSGLPDSATIEHVVPLGNGGLRLWGNEVAAHARCNADRATTPLDPVSVAIAMELMGGERRLQAAATLRKARALISNGERSLLDAVAVLRDIEREPEAQELLRRVQAMLSSTPALPQRPSVTMADRLAAARHVAVRLGRRLILAARAAAQASIHAWRADAAQGGGTVVDVQADWQRRYGHALSTHIGRRPKGYARQQWRARFFLAFPDALTHPACPVSDGLSPLL